MSLKIDNTVLDFFQGDPSGVKADALVVQGIARPEQGVGVDGGEFPGKFIIQAVTVDEELKTNEQLLRSAWKAIFNQSEELGVKTLVVGALGSDARGFPPLAAAKIMAQEILKAARFGKNPPQNIIAAIADKTLFSIYEREVKSYITHVQTSLGRGPYNCVDVIVETAGGIVIIERSNPPFGWALPGGFVDYGESLEAAACREIREETALELVDLKQFHTYSDPKRDPRFHTISTVFTARGVGVPKFGDDAKGLKIIPEQELLAHEFAFDHKDIIRDFLRGKGLI